MTLPSDARPIPGWTGYLATPAGDIWSTRSRWSRHSEAHQLAPNLSASLRYYNVALQDGERRATPKVHALIALVFIGPRPPGAEINHRDGDRFNNASENLEYVTPEENRAHALRNGLGTPRKLTEEDVCAAYFMRETGNYQWRALAECFDVSYRTLVRRVRAAGAETGTPAAGGTGTGGEGS